MIARAVFRGLSGVVVRGLRQKATICRDILARIDGAGHGRDRDLRDLRAAVEGALDSYTSVGDFIETGSAGGGRLDPKGAMAHGRDLDDAERILSAAQRRLRRRLSEEKAHAA